MAGMGSGEREPLRLAGYGLLGVAAIAAIVGLISMAGPSAGTPSDASNQAAPAGDTAAPPAPPAPPAAAGTPNNLGAPIVAPPAPAVPAPAVAAPAVPAPAAPAPLPAAGLPSDNGLSAGKKGGYSASSTAKAPARVYNNSLIKGLADKAADDMRSSGWNITEVGNYSSGNIPTSTVYYRAGTSEQAAAKHLASSFGMIAAPRFSGIADASPGLIVILTKDYQQR